MFFIQLLLKDGQDAAKDRNYVNDCYELVHHQMQEELNQLVIDTQKYP